MEKKQKKKPSVLGQGHMWMAEGKSKRVFYVVFSIFASSEDTCIGCWLNGSLIRDEEVTKGMPTMSTREVRSSMCEASRASRASREYERTQTECSTPSLCALSSCMLPHHDLSIHNPGQRCAV